MGYKFESDIDMSLSNSSIGADAPAATFGKTACADFVSARYIKVSKFGSKNKDSKKAEEKRMKQQLAALARKNEKKKKK